MEWKARVASEKRLYAFIAGITVLALVAVVVLAAVGVAGPGLISSSSAFLALGGAAAVLSISLVATALRMRFTVDMVAEREAEQEQIIQALASGFSTAKAENQKIIQSGMHAAKQDLRAAMEEAMVTVDRVGDNTQALAQDLERNMARVTAFESEAKQMSRETSAKLDETRRNVHQDLSRTKENVDRRLSDAAQEMEKRQMAIDKMAADTRKKLDSLRHAPLAESERADIIEEVVGRIEDRFAQLVAGQEKALGAYQGWLDQELESFLHAGGHASKEHEDTPAISRAEPFGLVYPVIEIEGIGEKTAYKLQEHGILDTRALWHADAHQVARQLGIIVNETRRWQAQAELMAIDGIGSQYAEILVEAGVRSIPELLSCDADDLAKRIARVRKGGRLNGAIIKEPLVRRWVEAAKEHAPTSLAPKRPPRPAQQQRQEAPRHAS